MIRIPTNTISAVHVPTGFLAINIAGRVFLIANWAQKRRSGFLLLTQSFGQGSVRPILFSCFLAQCEGQSGIQVESFCLKGENSKNEERAKGGSKGLAVTAENSQR